MKKSDLPIQYAEEEPCLTELTGWEVFCLLLLALVLVVIGFIAGCGVASWIN